jgi:hypothetical protein
VQLTYPVRSHYWTGEPKPHPLGRPLRVLPAAELLSPAVLGDAVAAAAGPPVVNDSCRTPAMRASTPVLSGGAAVTSAPLRHRTVLLRPCWRRVLPPAVACWPPLAAAGGTEVAWNAMSMRSSCRQDSHNTAYEHHATNLPNLHLPHTSAQLTRQRTSPARQPLQRAICHCSP